MNRFTTGVGLATVAHHSYSVDNSTGTVRFRKCQKPAATSESY
jgi:hypothetical protein